MITDADILLNQNDLLHFIPYLTPDFQSPYHLTPLIDILNQIHFHNKSKKILLTVPPRHFKTETILHFIALYLANNPKKNIAYFGYEQTFAESKTLMAQRYAIKAGVTPDKDMQNRRLYWTNEGGSLFTSAIGGTGTGLGWDCGIIDDPVKNRQEAESKVYRDRTWGWFEDVYERGQEPGNSTIVVMTRWHEDDLGGRIIKNRPEYKVINLPALNEHEEALFPERFSKEDLLKIKADKPYTFAALYQGKPQSRENMPFKDVHYYRELPEGMKYGSGSDLAYTEKKRADKSAFVRMGTQDGMYYVTFVDYWQEEINYTVKHLKNIQSKYPERIRVEANGPQKAVADLLDSQGVFIEPTTPIGDKYSRALELIELWNAGKILLPDPDVFPDAQWRNDYIEEVLSFTGITDDSDDMVDATVYALQECGGGLSFWSAA